MTAPEDNSAVLQAADDIRAYEYDRGKASRQAEVDGLRLDLDAAHSQIMDQNRTITEQAAEIQRLNDLLNPPPSAPDARALVGVVTPWQTADYKDIPGTFARLDALGVKVIRGRWLSGGRGDQVMAACALRGMKWLVTFAPESWTEQGAGTLASQLKTLETWMRAAFAHPNAASVVLAVENINEPEHVRGGGQPVSDWAARVAAYSLKMRDVRDSIGASWPILSSALNDKLQDDTAGAGWVTLSGSGMHCDGISLHGYLKGQPLDGPLLEERIARASVIGADLPVWLTETGAVTEPAKRGGPVVVSRQEQADLYASIAQTVFDHERLHMAFLFELNDAMPANTEPEGNRGLYDGAGQMKPAAVVMRDQWTASA